MGYGLWNRQQINKDMNKNKGQIILYLILSPSHLNYQILKYYKNKEISINCYLQFTIYIENGTNTILKLSLRLLIIVKQLSMNK